MTDQPWQGGSVRSAETATGMVFALLGLLAGCTGNGQGLDQNGQPSGSGGGGPLTADFASILANVFTPICTRCHSGASAPEGLQLDAAHSYALLVGVPSAEQSSLLRVQPGDPDSSYMIRKIQGGPGISGGQMPLGGPPLPQSTIDIMRQWVTEGALNSTATAMAAVRHAAQHPFELTATSPSDAADVAAPLRSLVVAFSNELDVGSVNDTTVQLEAIEPDSELLAPRGAALRVHLALASGNPAAIIVTPEQALPPGRYKLTLRGTAGGALQDVSGATLDADEYVVFSVHAARIEDGVAR